MNPHMASPFDQIEPTPGSPTPLGVSFANGRCNFALFSSHAKAIILGLFGPNQETPGRTVQLQRTGDIWHVALKNVPAGALYAFQCQGEWNEETGDLFRQGKWLLDPYAKIVDSSTAWNQKPLSSIRGFVQEPSPKGTATTPLPSLAREDLIIYEMHIRGFTSAVSGGTYSAMIDKIPYLQELGVNAVELMPIFEFDECHCKNIDPDTKKQLPNYWGYNPLSFFAAKRSFGTLSQLKKLIDELHKHRIEVFLDVVYNHSGEGGEKEYAISFRGIDNRAYYFADNHPDYSGCKNTINASHPAVEQLILDSLRYWAAEMQIDGFRFDLASILTRGEDGGPLAPSPLIKKIGADPLLSKRKLIAESWDAAGLYQVGSFPKWGPWMEWNGQYRDVARKFLKGTDGMAGPFANALLGSNSLYLNPLSSINFITAHDGFSLRDLVTYQDRHNWANGESNRDGASHSDNWNCGTEGETGDPQIIALRERQMRNHWLALLLSQGIPMLLMGDEYGHTRRGNNNPYVQDNELNWFLWDELEKHRDIFAFVKGLIAFRKKHPELKRTRFPTEHEIAWHGRESGQPDWSHTSRFVAYSTNTTPKLYIAFNADYRTANIALPSNTSWKLVVNTNEGWDQHFFAGNGKKLQANIELAPYSAFVAKEIE